MNNRLSTALLLAAACAMPAMAVEDAKSSNDVDTAKIKALEAELSALRAQLQATSQVRGEDRDRASGSRRGNEFQIDIQGDFEGGMDEMPEFVRDMVMDRMGGGDEPMSIMINGREMIVGDTHGERNRSEHHQVMRFDLGDMTDGDMEGEVHIELMGDRDMGHLAEVIPHLLMAGMMEDDMWDKERGMDMGDKIGEELMRRMRQHDLPMEMITDYALVIDNEHTVVDSMDMLIDRLKREGHDPSPIMELRHGVIEHLDRRDAELHGGRVEDPYMQQGSEFVEKMFLSEEIGHALSDERAVSIFCIWEARQHMQPQERIEALFPVMINDEVDMAVRNAAAMVVRQSFYEIGDRPKAIETLRNQILVNEGVLD